MRTSELARYAGETAHLITRGQPYESYLVEGLAALVGVDAGAAINTVTNSAESSRSTVAEVEPMGSARLRQCVAVAPSHPAVRGFRRVAAGEALRTSDLVRLRAFWGTEAYEAMHGPEDGRYSVGMAVSLSPSTLVFVGLQRRHRDFTDVEVEALDRVQRVVVAALTIRQTLDSVLADPAARPSRFAPIRGAGPSALRYQPTARERDVLELICRGWTSRRIASALGISERTVRKHLGNVYAHAQLTSRAEAASWWQRCQPSGP